MNELVNVADKLKRTQEELGRHGKLARARTIKVSVLWCAFGAALGMTGMVYLYEQQPKPQPVVHVEVPYATPALDAALDKLKTSLDSPSNDLVVAGGQIHFFSKNQESGCVRYKKDDTPGVACPAPPDQRVKELRFSLQKLERLKDVHDATLREAATNQGDIRQMVERLGVWK